MDAETPSPSDSDPPDYNDVVIFEESPLYQAVVNFDDTEVRHLLDLNYSVNEVGKFNQTLLHAMLYSLTSQSQDQFCCIPSTLHIVYMLSNAGIDVNIKDQTQRSALHYAAIYGDPKLCEVLLQCGSDMFIMDQDGIPLFDEIVSIAYQGPSAISASKYNNITDMFMIFNKYKPGLWHAVATEALADVRKLINLWCKTDLEQNCKTLLELSLDTGNSGVISLLTAVIPSMRLVHHVLADDVRGVKQLLHSSLRPKIHIDLKNLGYHSAPILYFVIKEKNLEMLKEFKKHGCSIISHMQDSEDCDMPVLFSALQADIPAMIISELLPDPQSDHLHLMERLTYKGKNILQIALENDVAEEAIETILERGGARLLADRDVYNQTVRDWAIQNEKIHYLAILDKHVVQWILQPHQFPGRRQILALWGYDHITDVVYQWMQNENIQVDDLDPNVLQFLESLDMYQEQICELANATEDGDKDYFVEKMYFNENTLFEKDLWWEARPKGDGLPMLHRATLNNHLTIVEIILQNWEDKGCIDAVDNLRDQAKRTALHYACGMTNAAAICSLLHQYGCSEHVLDKDGHEPLDFTEVQQTPEMMALLNRINNKKYDEPEPNPWNPELLAELRRQKALRYSIVPYKPCDHICHRSAIFKGHAFHHPNSFHLSPQGNFLTALSHSQSFAAHKNQAFTPTVEKMPNLKSTNLNQQTDSKTLLNSPYTAFHPDEELSKDSDTENQDSANIVNYYDQAFTSDSEELQGATGGCELSSDQETQEIVQFETFPQETSEDHLNRNKVRKNLDINSCKVL